MKKKNVISWIVVIKQNLKLKIAILELSTKINVVKGVISHFYHNLICAARNLLEIDLIPHIYMSVMIHDW